jgi:hypothetical protein
MVTEHRRERSAAFTPLQLPNGKRAKDFLRLVKLDIEAG